MKASQTFKLEPSLIASLKKFAKQKNRSFNNYVETVLMDHSEAQKLVNLLTKDGKDTYFRQKKIN